jgi:hypothetical protein
MGIIEHGEVISYMQKLRSKSFIALRKSASEASSDRMSRYDLGMIYLDADLQGVDHQDLDAVAGPPLDRPPELALLLVAQLAVAANQDSVPRLELEPAALHVGQLGGRMPQDVGASPHALSPVFS